MKLITLALMAIFSMALPIASDAQVVPASFEEFQALNKAYLKGLTKIVVLFPQPPLGDNALESDALSNLRAAGFDVQKTNETSRELPTLVIQVTKSEGSSVWHVQAFLHEWASLAGREIKVSAISWQSIYKHQPVMPGQPVSVDFDTTSTDAQAVPNLVRSVITQFCSDRPSNGHASRAGANIVGSARASDPLGYMFAFCPPLICP